MITFTSLTDMQVTVVVCLAAAAVAAGGAVAFLVAAGWSTLLGRLDGQVAGQATGRRQWAVDLSGTAALLLVTALVAEVIA